MSQIILAFNVRGNAFVPNYNGSDNALPAWRQGRYDVIIYLVQPAVNVVPGAPGSANWKAFDASSFDGLRVGFWKDSTGTLNDEDANVLALTDQLGWTYNTDDPDLPYFSGVLNTLTQEMADWIGSGNAKAAYFAVNLTKGLYLSPIYDQKGGTNTIVYSATDGGDCNPIVMTGRTGRMPLPLEFGPDANGKIFVLTSIPGDPPTLQFTCINP